MQLARVRTVITGFAGGPGLMTHFFHVDGDSWNSASASNAIDRLRDACTASNALWPSTFRWTVQPDVDIFSDVTGDLSETLSGTERTGTGTSGETECGPGNVGTQVRLHTAGVVHGRRVVGSTFLVPQTRTNTSHELPDPTNITTAEAFGTSLLDAGLSGVNLVVWSRPFPGRPASAGPPLRAAIPARAGTSYTVTSTSVRRKWVTLRSRRD